MPKTTITVDRWMLDRLFELKDDRSESYQDVIIRLMDEHEEEEQ